MNGVPCEVCGSQKNRFLYEGRDRVFGIPGEFSVVECQECGLIFIHPQPDLEALKAFYPKVYYTSHPSHYKPYSWLRRKTLEAYFGYGNSSPSHVLQWLKRIALLPCRYRYRHAIAFVEGGGFWISDAEMGQSSIS